jgi:cobalt-zinc-cadmium efflux system membrane fusion protein
MLVLAALGGLAYFGHSTGWTVPKFSSLTGNGQAEMEDWCGAHAVPESECVECNPALLPKGKEFGWCKVHGIPECPLDHPEVAQLKEKPPVSEADRARTERALASTERTENNSKCKLHLRRIQFASKEAVEKAGIDVAPAWEARMVETVLANGEITYDQTRVARLSTRAPGSVWRVEKKVGDAVQDGEVLALVDGAEVGRAKTEFLQAFAQFRLKNNTWQSFERSWTAGALPEARYREAETALSEARIRLLSAQQSLINLGLPISAEELKGLSENELALRLQFLGLPEAVTAGLDPKKTTANLIPVKSPLDGVVVFREVVAGEVVETSKTLFIIADTSRMWLTLHVRQEDTKGVCLGQSVRFRPDGGAEEVTGKLDWISPAVDEKTRTVKVRAPVDNRYGRQRANTFGPGRIVLREEKNAVVVPTEAVQWEGDCHIVFVRDKNFFCEGAPKVFHVRKVRLGTRDEKSTEIIAGVLPGEVVATKGSGTLRGELLKNNLGEG